MSFAQGAKEKLEKIVLWILINEQSTLDNYIAAIQGQDMIHPKHTAR
jgi:hypothetical protein